MAVAFSSSATTAHGRSTLLRLICISLVGLLLHLQQLDWVVSAQVQVLPLSFLNPYGVLYDGFGNLYVSDSVANSIIKLTTAGEKLATFTFSPALYFPSKISQDSVGLLYVADSFNNRVLKFAPNGTQLAVFTTSNPALSQPWSVFIDSFNNMWIADVGNNRIVELYPNGTQRSVLTTTNPALSRPADVVADAAGSVYVVDEINNRLIKRSSNGTVTTLFTALTHPEQMLLDAVGGTIFIADTFASRIVQVSLNGTLLQVLTLPTTGEPCQMTLDNAGNLYTADYPNGRVLRYTSVIPLSSVQSSTASLSSSNSALYSSSSLTSSSSSSCGTPQVSGPYTISTSSNLALPMKYLWNDPINSYSDVPTTVQLYAGGGVLTIYDVVDSNSSAWCYYETVCQGPQGGPPVVTYGTPSAGWPGSTASYPTLSLLYRFAPQAANSSTSLTEYLPVFNSSTLSAHISLPPSFPGGQRLWLTACDWSAADDIGAVHVMVSYTPSSIACNLLSAPSTPPELSLSSSSLSAYPAVSYTSSQNRAIDLTANSSVSSFNPASFFGRWMARGIQQSLYSNPYLPAIYLIGGQGTAALTGAVWESLDGGVTWSALGSNLTLSAIPTFMGAAVALLVNGVLVIYGGQLSNGSATSYVATTSTLFSTVPLVYTAPFTPRYDHAYTTILGSNMTLFCGGLTSSNATVEVRG